VVLRDGNLDKYIFMQPENPRASIWRYLDLAKYEYMLSKRSLYFPNVLLFKDGFEGSYPEQIPQIHNNLTSENTKRLYELHLRENPDDANHLLPLEELLKASANMRLFGRGYTFSSCWHMAEHESLAMWEIYGGQNKRIAIKTTYEKLDQQIAASLKVNSLFCDFTFIGCVKYADFENETNLIYLLPPTRYFLKRLPYEFEKEIRVVLVKISGNTNYKGVSIPLDLEGLIQRVRVSPGSGIDFRKEVLELTEKYGFKFSVESSELDKSPVF